MTNRGDTMPHPFDGIAAKLDRAAKHIKQLNTDIDAFLEEASDRVFVDADTDDADAAKAFRQRQESRTVPPLFSVVAGEVLFHLRSSLDHVVAFFVDRDGGTVSRHTQFPIFDSRPQRTQKNQPTSYERNVEGIKAGGPVAALIESSQPYHRGHASSDDPLSIVAKLNNIDKHRRLVLHVIHIEYQVGATVRFDDGTVQRIGPSTTDEHGTDGWHSHTISTDTGLGVMDVQRQLTAHVAFGEPGAINGVPVVKALRVLLRYVDAKVRLFAEHV